MPRIIRNLGFDVGLETICLSIWHQLSTAGALIVNNVPVDVAVLKKISGLICNGPILRDDHSQICDVKVASQNVDDDGAPIPSRTSHSITLHTDGYLYDIEPEIVSLMCFRPSNSGGDTQLLWINDIVHSLEPGVLTCLQHECYPSLGRTKSLLKWSSSGWQIRFNGEQIRHMLSKDHHRLDVLHRDALQEFIRIIEGSRQVVTQKLKAGDWLFIDNFAVLHGRSAFGGEEDRLLKRIRFQGYAFGEDRKCSVLSQQVRPELRDPRAATLLLDRPEALPRLTTGGEEGREGQLD